MSKDKDAAPEEMRASNQAPISDKTLFQQGLQKPSRTPQQHITNSSKEFVMCDSDTLLPISQGEETAHAPLRGASPSPIDSVSESEELPTVTDCTTLALVDDAPSQPTSLSDKNQESGEEQKDSYEGLSSAVPSAPLLQNLTNTEILNILDSANQGVCPSIDAIAVLMKTSHARSLMGAITQNPQWGIKLSDYSTVPQGSKLRSGRLSRLKSYAANCECPPEEFLLECQSDPVLKIQLSRLAAQKHWDIQEIFPTKG